MFCGVLNFDQKRCIRTWPIFLVDFLVEFFKCWKYPSNSSETFKILFFHQNNQFEAKTACFADFSILTKIAVSGPYRRGHFVSWFFWLIFWNVENTLPILLKHSKCCSFIKTISMFCGIFNFDQNRCIRTLPAWPFCCIFWFKCWKYPSNSSETFKMLFFQTKQSACFADFSILTKIAVSGPYPFSWLIFLVEFFEMLKIPFQFFWNIQNVVLSSKQSDWSKSSMFCGLFNFDQNRCIRTLPAWPFCWLIFLVEFFKCWKYPSNSSETFKILFFHQNNQFEAKTACFADFSILTKIAVSGPYRRGHFSVDFLKCWKYPSNSSETFKILFFHQNNQFEAKTACFADFSILTKIAVSGPYRRGHFVSWFFWLIFWNVENTLPILLKHSKCCSFIKTISMFCGLFNFDQNRCIRNLPAWPFFWLIFWNVENTLPILLKHSKCCSFKNNQHVLRSFQFWPKSVTWPIFMVDFFGWFFEILSNQNIQNVVLSSKQPVWSSMFCGIFNFDQNRCIRTLPAWPFCWLIFLVEFFKCWKYPSNSSETFKICSFIKTISLKQKQHVLRTFQFWPKSLYPDLTGVAILLVDFFGWFFEMLKIPFQFFWNIKMLFFHQNNQHVLRTFQFWRKLLYPELTGVIILLVDFFGWVFQMLKIPFEFFWNIQNFVLSSKQWVWSKNSMFCWLFNFDQNRCIRTLPAWPFFGWFFEMLKISNSSEFKILLIKTISWSKNSMFCGLFLFDQNRCIRTLPNFVTFFWLIFWNVENTLPILLKHSKCCSFIKTISMFCGIFNFDQNRCIRTLPAWPFCWLIFWLSFSNVENTLPILLKHSKCCSFILSKIKTISMFCGLFNFDQNRCIRTLPIFMVDFFGWVFWNVENTLPILLKHSKCCSFIKTISLKQKQHVLRTFQFWPKSLYPDLTGVAILLVDFFGWFFEMLKIPFQFFWNIQNVVLSSKQSVWSKNSMFCWLFNFDQNRCIRTLPAWPFC